MHSQGRLITESERDSIFSKIQRGKIDAERVVHLTGALNSCDSIKGIHIKVIGIQEMQIDSLFKVISNDKLIMKNMEDVTKLEIDRERKKGKWKFLKGAGVGAGIVILLTVL